MPNHFLKKKKYFFFILFFFFLGRKASTHAARHCFQSHHRQTRPG